MIHSISLVHTRWTGLVCFKKIVINVNIIWYYIHKILGFSTNSLSGLVVMWSASCADKLGSIPGLCNIFLQALFYFFTLSYPVKRNNLITPFRWVNKKTRTFLIFFMFILWVILLILPRYSTFRSAHPLRFELEIFQKKASSETNKQHFSIFDVLESCGLW